MRAGSRCRSPRRSIPRRSGRGLGFGGWGALRPGLARCRKRHSGTCMPYMAIDGKPLHNVTAHVVQVIAVVGGGVYAPPSNYNGGVSFARYC